MEFEKYILILIGVIEFIFFKKLKWNILPHKSVIPSTRGAKEKRQDLNNIYKGNQKQKKMNKREETISLCPIWWTG